MEDRLQPVVIIAGNSASGKTTLARQLADTLDFSFLDLGSVVRCAALEAINHGVSLTNPEAVGKFATRLLFHFSVEGKQVCVGFGESMVNDTDQKLRQAFLDTDTLLLAQAMRQPLRMLQRDIASDNPVVFSARNGKAFTHDEAVKIFIDPGTSSRIRRKAIAEYQRQYPQLTRDEKRSLIQRVVIKERENVQLGTGMTTEQIADEHFIVVQNRGTIMESLVELERIARSSFKERI